MDPSKGRNFLYLSSKGKVSTQFMMRTQCCESLYVFVELMEHGILVNRRPRFRDIVLVEQSKFYDIDRLVNTLLIPDEYVLARKSLSRF